MSATSTAKTQDEIYLDQWYQYRAAHHGPVCTKEFARWVYSKELIPNPKIDLVKIHEQKVKQALRRNRIKDLTGRKIKPWVAVKIEKMTANGQKLIQVVVNHLHEMSLDHALTAFGQCDDLISKQRRSATRNLQSFLEFNPNAVGHERLFVFAFMDEEPVEAMMETIEESPTPTKASYPPTQPR